MNLRYLIVVFLCAAPFLLHAQIDSLRKYEMKIKVLGDSMLDSENQGTRLSAVFELIPTFQKCIAFKGSFQYPFDSLKFMTKLKSDDGLFRIYNWNVRFQDGSLRFYGAVQFNPEQKKYPTKLIPLFDKADKSDSLIAFQPLDHQNWYGAQYYQLITKEVKTGFLRSLFRKEYRYTLIGWDGSPKKINRKIIEPLVIGRDGELTFGAPYIHDLGQEQTVKLRKIFEYKKDAVMHLKYNPQKKAIVFDNLIPPNPANKGMTETYVPEGTYDYFVYENGIWKRKYELFDSELSPADEMRQNR